MLELIIFVVCILFLFSGESSGGNGVAKKKYPKDFDHKLKADPPPPAKLRKNL